MKTELSETKENINIRISTLEKSINRVNIKLEELQNKLKVAKSQTLEKYLYTEERARDVPKNNTKDFSSLEKILSPDPSSKIMLVSHVPFGQKILDKDATEGLITVSNVLNVGTWMAADFIPYKDTMFLSKETHETAKEIMSEKNVSKDYSYLLAKIKIAKSYLKDLNQKTKINYIFSKDADVQNINIIYKSVEKEELEKLSAERAVKLYKIKEEKKTLAQLKKKGLSEEEYSKRLSELEQRKSRIGTVSQLKATLDRSALQEKAKETYKGLLRELHPNISIYENLMEEEIMGKIVSVKTSFNPNKRGINVNPLGKMRTYVEGEIRNSSAKDIYIELGKEGLFEESVLRPELTYKYHTFMTGPTLEDADKIKELIYKEDLNNPDSVKRVLKGDTSPGAILLEMTHPLSDRVFEPIKLIFTLDTLRNYRNASPKDIRETKLHIATELSDMHIGKGGSLLNERTKELEWIRFAFDNLIRRYETDQFIYQEGIQGSPYSQYVTETRGKEQFKASEESKQLLEEMIKAETPEKKAELAKRLQKLYDEALFEKNVTSVGDQFLSLYKIMDDYLIDLIGSKLGKIKTEAKNGKAKEPIKLAYPLVKLFSGNHFDSTIEKDDKWGKGFYEGEIVKSRYDMTTIMKARELGLDVDVDSVVTAPMLSYMAYDDSYLHGFHIREKHKFGFLRGATGGFNPLDSSLRPYLFEKTCKDPIHIIRGAHNHYYFMGLLNKTFAYVKPPLLGPDVYGEGGGKDRVYSATHLGFDITGMPKEGPGKGPYVMIPVFADLIDYEMNKTKSKK